MFAKVYEVTGSMPRALLVRTDDLVDPIQFLYDHKDEEQTKFDLITALWSGNFFPTKLPGLPYENYSITFIDWACEGCTELSVDVYDNHNYADYSFVLRNDEELTL